MTYNSKFLIRRSNRTAEAMNIRAYRYKTCSIMDSTEEYDGKMMHIISMRAKDCEQHLSKDELYGILENLGMRRDGTLQMQQTNNGRVVHFMQPAA